MTFNLKPFYVLWLCVIEFETFLAQIGPLRGRERRDSFTGPGLEKGARKTRKQKKKLG
jgi:hypothetical protein